MTLLSVISDSKYNLAIHLKGSSNILEIVPRCSSIQYFISVQVRELHRINLENQNYFNVPDRNLIKLYNDNKKSHLNLQSKKSIDTKL